MVSSSAFHDALENRQRVFRLVAIAMLVGTVVAAYLNAIGAPFVFDDGPAIVENPTIRSFHRALFPPTQKGSPVNSRPLLNVSFAANYAIGGKDPRGYHLANIAIHAFAALTVFGIARRTFLQTALRGRFGSGALWLAFSIALLWAVHPLQTESVTYLSQRAESLAGFFCLLTIYAFVRAAESTGSDNVRVAGHARLWLAGSVVFCAAGMATKEIAATVPLLVLLYDRTFVAGTFGAAWQQRKRYYLALAGTWVLLVTLVVSGGGRAGTAGFGAGLPWWAYALKQCEAVVHYVRLAVWPRPLVLDYGIDVVMSPAQVGTQIISLVLLVGGTIAALRWRPAIGFLGAWFCLTLAPSSSVVPVVTQTMAEHRMYLALAALVVAGVLTIHRFAGRQCLPIGCALAVALGWCTCLRNADYRSELVLWSDTVAKRPQNPRAHNNLGKALIELNEIERSLPHFQEALRLAPNYSETHNNMGYVLARLGRFNEAVTHYGEALVLGPTNARAHSNLGNALGQLHRYDEAVAHFRDALRLDPEMADAHWGWGNVLVETGRAAEAQKHYEEALHLDSDFSEAHSSLAGLLAASGRTAEAIDHYQRALQTQPTDPELNNNLGNQLHQAGRNEEAIARYRAALNAKPDFVDARVNLANVLAETGERDSALREYDAAIRQKPDSLEARTNFGSMLAEAGHMADALPHFEAAARLDPKNSGVHLNLGNALLLLGRTADARACFVRALELDPGNPVARETLRSLDAFAGTSNQAP